MRPAVSVEIVEPPESHSHDIPSDDGVLFGIMVASGLLLLIRVAMVLISLCKHPGAVSQIDEKSRNISKGVPFFVVALATVLMKIASVTAHGLVAINWLLAGAEPGVPLVACFVLVAINTHLLTSVAIVVHLRALLASVAICKQSNIKFQGISNLWGAPAGVTCLLVNGLATAILLAYLHHRSGKITTWLVTAMSFLLWANTNFKSVGLMDSETWEDVQRVGSVSKPPIAAAEFMRSIGMIPESQAETDETDETGETGDSSHVSKLLQMVFLKFNKEDELLLQHRRRLVRSALPESPRLRLVHGAMILFLGLLSTAVPSILVGYCLSRTPLLSDVEVVGGSLAPSFTSRFDYYIQVQHAGSSGIKMTFLMDLGEASAYTFCCQADCSKVEARESSQVRLQSIIAPRQFGTCQLELRGLRRSSYSFTVLALRNLVPSLSIAADESFAPYDPKRHLYHMDIIKPDMDSLMLATKFDMDQTRMRVAIWANSCAANASCSTLPTAKSPGSVDVDVNISAMTGPLNVTLVIALRPAEDIDGNAGNATYTVSLVIFTIKDRLKDLLWQISELKARIATGQEVDSDVAVAENVQQLAAAVRSRDELLRRAQRARQCISGSHERFSFLAVGVTGTGKSELCRWMTGNETACPSSDSLGSHTEEVQQVPAHAFADACQPLIEWIDTPGRGDTRGKDHDAKLWNQTMSELKDANRATRIHRIVWVINAAWQRATDVRELMLKELRMSFGVDLYKNLAIVLNFLPRTANKTSFWEIKQRHKERFVEWIMQREDVMFQWPSQLRKGVEDEVKNIEIYGININPKYLKEKPSDVPISTPYLNLFYPFADAGVDDLTALLTSTVNQTRGGHGLLLDNPHPRVGPGQADNVSLAWSCLPWRSDNAIGTFGATPFGTLKREVVITFEAHGKYLSDGDKALLLPASASCGDRSAEGWPDRWWTKVLNSKPHLPGNESTTFQSLQGAFPESAQLCFCEASGCNESWRFGQKLAFQLPASDCKSITTYSVPNKPKPVANPWNLVSVGNRVLGVPKDGGLPMFEYRMVEGRMADYKEYNFDEEHQKHWFQTVVSNGTLYLLAKEGKFFLAVDINQHPPMPGTLVNTHTGLQSHEWHFFGMAIVGSSIYLVPGRETEVRILDLATGSFRASVDIKGSYTWWVQSYNKFGFPCVSQNQIFAPPWEVEAFFVMNLLDDTAQGKQIAFDPGEEMPKCAWSEFVEFAGFLYASPYNAKTILRVSPADLTWIKLEVGLSWPPRWSGSAVLGTRIFYASTESLGTVDILETETSELKYIVAESPELPQNEAVDFFSGAQRTIVAVDNTLQVSPGLNGAAILVVNVSAGIED